MEKKTQKRLLGALNDTSGYQILSRHHENQKKLREKEGEAVEPA